MTLTLTLTLTLMRDFRNYDIWIDAMELVNEIYDLVEQFPEKERYILSSQVIRAAVSIPSNIAEGAAKSSPKDFSRFLGIALGSAFELETQILIAIRRNYIDKSGFDLNKLHSLQKRLQGFRNHLKK